MKKVIMLMAGLIASLLAFNGCEESEVFEDDYIVDWAPVFVYITAEDANGKDPISANMPGLTLTFQGTTYEVCSKEEAYSYPETASKAYLAVIYGFYCEYGLDYSDSVLSPNRLVFGEIDGAADMEEDIVITWGDGSTDTIHYSCSDHKEGRNPTCKRSWTLNGAAHKDNRFHLMYRGSTSPVAK